MGRKRNDIHAAFGCAVCHDFVDGRQSVEWLDPLTVRRYFLEAIVRTQEFWLERGYIKEG